MQGSRTFRVTTTLFLLALLVSSTTAQKNPANEAEYRQMKLEGTLPAPSTLDRPAPKPILPDVRPAGASKGGGGGLCNCWIEPDASYTTIDNINGWDAGGFANSDDGSYGPIILPFGFFLYGQTWTDAYININGNVSFGSYYSTFSSSGFPVSGFTMVAPFWADVDLGGVAPGANIVQFKVTPTALYVNWTNVGYFNEQTDLLSTFQLIITDGNDPIVNGANVSFCYKDMQWTTGSASQGVGGFGGVPARVGANHGNGIDYIQFGAFDQPGIAYDGPFAMNDGVDWLDNQYFSFSTDITTANVPPVIAGQSVCDSVVVCVGITTQLDVTFLSPEPNQITVPSSTAPTLSNYTILSSTSGLNADISTSFTPTAADVGFHVITFQGADNGIPPLTSTLNINVQVITAPGAPPVIIGDSIVCPGELSTLTATGGFTNFDWSHGPSATSVQVGPGTYTVSVGGAGCALVSDPFTVTQASAVSPVITGAAVNCGGRPAVLQTSQSYDSYLWSTNEVTDSISVGTGTYTVTVTDANGCSGTSAAVNVVSAPDPAALFTTQPSSPALNGTAVSFNDASTITGGTIISWSYTIGTDTVLVGSPDQVHLFTDPGVYSISYTVTTADGCSDTYTFNFVIIPDQIILPNVISPNGDGENDRLVIEGIEGYPNSKLTVYDRWGKSVYESGYYRNTWNASDVSEGTYFIVLQLSNGENMTGHLTVVR